VTRSVVRDNSSTASAVNQQLFGGGIFSQGTLVLEDSVVVGNRIEGPTSGSTTWLVGAGLHTRTGLATVTRVLFLDNHIVGDYIGMGAGLDTLGTLVLNQVDFRENSVEAGYAYGAAWSTRGGTTTAENVIAAGNSTTATTFNGFGGAVVANSTLLLTNATFFGNSMTAAGSTNGCVLRSSGGNVTLSNVIFESNVCDKGEVFSELAGTLTFDYVSMFGHTVADGLTPNLTDSASFVDTTGAARDWDLHLAETSLLRNVGAPLLLNPDGTRSDLGAYGGPGGDFSTP
jgi:hypothetical protein